MAGNAGARAAHPLVGCERVVCTCAPKAMHADTARTRHEMSRENPLVIISNTQQQEGEHWVTVVVYFEQDETDATTLRQRGETRPGRNSLKNVAAV